MILFLAMFVAAGTATAFVSWRTSPKVRVRPPEHRSAYLNTRPGVRYLGDSACIRCHADISESYRRHPMGRSLAPIAAAPTTGDNPKVGRPLFEAQGLQYWIEHREGRVIHKETRSDASGRLIAQNEAEAQFVLGAGRQGLAYLIERDGFLFESPIAWYPQERQWDLSPGYESNNSHFSRPIGPECLFCHTNLNEPVAGTVNRYQQPIFRDHAIGCERCHGPGELHVAAPTVVDGRDLTIVNPAQLEPSLRDAVCEQCHLIGQHRIVRAGRREQEYRPGLPFHRYWSVLELAGGFAQERFVGQVEQMHESRCFRGSRGRLGCVSCHDPHELPEPEKQVAYYRSRCLECHGDRGCAFPPAVRLARSREDNCIGCHMPRSKSSNVLHVATTNHRVPRHGDGTGWPPPPPASPRDGYRPLVNFHRFLMDERERSEANRDLGVALCREGADGAAVALPLLEAALVAQPDDVPAWEAKGLALGRLNRSNEGLGAFRSALSKDPRAKPHGSARPILRPRPGDATTPSPTGSARSQSPRGARITTPSLPTSTSSAEIGTGPPKRAGKPSGSTPSTARSARCSSSLVLDWETSGPRAPSSTSSWDSTHRTVTSCCAGLARSFVSVPAP